MALLNKYSLYSVNYSSVAFVSEITTLLNELDKISNNEIEEYLYEKFGKFEETKTLDYPKTKEQLVISISDDKILLKSTDLLTQIVQMRIYSKK